jgi:crossover junction endodeoxyribonuclease RusA
MTVIRLPYPPSVNNYYQRNRFGGVRVSKHGKEYRTRVFFDVKQQNIPSYGEKLIKMQVLLFMPDRRKRDGDNVFKALFDALEYAKVYENDSQIYDCRWTKVYDSSETGVLVNIEEYEADL